MGGVGDDGDGRGGHSLSVLDPARRPRGLPRSYPAPPWASPSSPARPASSARTSRGCSSSAATRARRPSARARALEQLDGLDVEQVRADVLDRASVRRALRGVTRVFHVAGLTSLRGGADTLFRVNVDGTRIVLEEALRAGRRARGAHLVGRRDRPGAARRDRRRDAGLPRRPLRPAVRQQQARGRERGAADRRPRPAARDRQPRPRDGPGRRLPLLDRARAPLPAPRRSRPTSTARSTSSTREDVARGHLLADERGALGERYILGNRNFTLDRLFADLGRLSGVEPPAVKLPRRRRRCSSRTRREAMPGTPVITVGEVRAASLWWAYRSTKAKRELGWKPSHHEDTLVDTIDWYREREPGGCGRPGRASRSLLRLAGFGAAPGVRARRRRCAADGDPLPLPHADRPALPLRPRRARAAPPGHRGRRGARPVAHARPRRGRARSAASARSRCSCSTARRSATRSGSSSTCAGVLGSRISRRLTAPAFGGRWLAPQHPLGVRPHASAISRSGPGASFTLVASGALLMLYRPA